MKFLLLLAFVAVAAAMRTFESEEAENLQIAEDFRVVFKISIEEGLECINKTGVRLANLDYWKITLDMEDNEITDKEGLKKACCALVCCAQKRGLMEGTDIQIEKMVDELRVLPLSVQTAVRKSATVCKEQVRDQKDLCFLGYDFFKCVIMTTSKMVARA
nr:uncharacterized protein LOC117221236 [Megalopta genalis]